MRFLFPATLLLSATALASPAAAPHSPGQRASFLEGRDCPSASSHFARRGGIWRHDPAKPKKLAELPPADTFAAVYRRDERGCIVPVRYRDVRR